MAHSELALRRARRAYETSHVVAAFKALVLGGVLVIVASTLHHTSRATWMFAATLVLALPALAWRGGSWRRGALAGVLAGLPPLIVPTLVIALSAGPQCASCDTSPSWFCVLSCLGASSLVGLVVGHRAVSERSPSRFAMAALTTAALTGLLGCGTTGLGGAAGVVVGIVAGGVTGWLVGARTVRAT
jgi:hypothetical protein